MLLRKGSTQSRAIARSPSPLHKKLEYRKSISARLVDALYREQDEGSTTEDENSTSEIEHSTIEDDEQPMGPRETSVSTISAEFSKVDLSILASLDKERPPCITNPHIWWRHPVLRLLLPWAVLFLDFYIYGADPVQDSHVQYPYFGVFEDMFIIKWPSNPAFQFCRIVLFIVIVMFGMWFGRQVIHHRFLRDFLGLKMFSNNNGTLLIMLLMGFCSFEYALPYPINLLESGTISSPITESSTLKYVQWGKIWQGTAAVFDMVSICMITDTVLQDRTVWPRWGIRLKWLWNDAWNGRVRVLTVWLTMLIMVPTIISGLYVSGHTNGVYAAERVLTAHQATTQWMRVALASLLAIIDITTCLQDWEFPAYNTPVNFRVTFTFLTELKLPCMSNLMEKISKSMCIPSSVVKFFNFQMSGKWIAYMPAFGSLGVDLWYLIRTIGSYSPPQVGEYERPEDCIIFVILNQTILDTAYRHGVLIDAHKDAIGWEARKNFTNSDMEIHSLYCNHVPFLSHLFLGIGITSGIAFVCLIFRAEYYWDRFVERHDEQELEDIMKSVQSLRTDTYAEVSQLEQ